MGRRKNFDRAEDTTSRLAQLRVKIPYDWEELDKLDPESLRRKIVETQQNLVETQREMANDLDLLSARDRLQQESAPYKEAKTRLSRMMEYCTLRLEELGR